MSDMTGKSVLVTGASNGMGLAAAQALAGMGASVVVVGRDAAKCRGVVERLPQPSAGGQHRSYAADLSSKIQVARLAQRLLSDLRSLDVLINNAGAWFSKRQLSEDGIEMNWALNHMSYFHLTQALLGLLQRTAAQHGEARIINQASAAHHEGRLHWNDLQFERTWDTDGRGSVGPGWGAYSQSKLANVAFTLALARKLEGSGISANAVHPGVVVTGFTQNNGALYKFAAPMRRLFNRRTPLDGAEPVIQLASSPQTRGISGKYYGPPLCEEAPSAQALERSSQDRLWALSEALWH